MIPTKEAQGIGGESRLKEEALKNPYLGLKMLRRPRVKCWRSVTAWKTN